ncbi:TlpA family protein disulfide reductase [Mariniblastus fucicola]|uniref:TlpA family protein disulfide reductase n=1 Tax=Mariniblastus fucicola TaxID=980251 RepID=UPI0009465F24|nr:TlpA disulfide reductase family protein [Mariniblastus fucicola]
MYPHERSLAKKLSDKPFAIIGVNSDKDRDSIREIVKEKNITWRSFWNGANGTQGPISSAWNVSSWPTIYILDAEGKIRFKNKRGSDMDKALTLLMREMGHEVDLTVHDEKD